MSTPAGVAGRHAGTLGSSARGMPPRRRQKTIQYIVFARELDHNRVRLSFDNLSENSELSGQKLTYSVPHLKKIFFAQDPRAQGITFHIEKSFQNYASQPPFSRPYLMGGHVVAFPAAGRPLFHRSCGTAHGCFIAWDLQSGGEFQIPPPRGVHPARSKRRMD